MAFLLWALVAASSVFVSARNVTVDDQGLQIRYSPIGVWTDTCIQPECRIRPDTERAHEGSWHDASNALEDEQQPSISFSFTGTELYVYGIIVNVIPELSTTTNLTFTLDGQTRDVYTHAPVLSAPTYEYDQLFFSEKDLPNSAHTFTMSVTAGTARSFAIFDYLTYVVPDDNVSVSATSSVPSSSSGLPAPTQSEAATGGSSSTSSSGSSNVGAIAGGVVAGVVVVAIAAVLWFILNRRKNKREATRPSAYPLNDTEKAFNDDTSPQPALTMASFDPLNPSTNVTTTTLAPNRVDPTKPTSSSSVRVGGASSKAALREEEISRQMQEMDAEIRRLQSQQNPRYSQENQTVLSDSSMSPSSEITPNQSASQYNPTNVSWAPSATDSRLQTEIDVLRREMESMRSQQRELIWELSQAPPPSYAADNTARR